MHTQDSQIERKMTRRDDLERLIVEWDRLRDSYMDAGVAIQKKAEMSRIAAAYEKCSDDLRQLLGEPPRWK